MVNTIVLLTFAVSKPFRADEPTAQTGTGIMATAKRTFIRMAYKAIQNATSKKYFDDCWQGVKDVVMLILASDRGVTLYLENAAYEGDIGHEGHRKV